MIEKSSNLKLMQLFRDVYRSNRAGRSQGEMIRQHEVSDFCNTIGIGQKFLLAASQPS
jgi:hypothetical protein